jgi:hypothetical protein
MPAPTTNNGVTYYNLNTCKSFSVALDTNLKAFPFQVCSEVIVKNTTGQGILVFDQENSTTTNAFRLSANEEFVFRGITNTAQVSAQTTAGVGILSIRTQFFSYSNQGV